MPFCRSDEHRRSCSATTDRSLPVRVWTCGPTAMGCRSTSRGPANRPTMPYVESFNGTLRAECLDVHWFATLTEAKQLIEAWRREYNESRPHRSLGERTPSEFAW